MITPTGRSQGGWAKGLGMGWAKAGVRVGVRDGVGVRAGVRVGVGVRVRVGVRGRGRAAPGR